MMGRDREGGYDSSVMMIDQEIDQKITINHSGQLNN